MLGFFVPSLLLSTVAHFGHIYKFLCWKSDEMKLSLLREAESPKEAPEWFQELGLQYGTKYLQVLGSRGTHITKTRALDHLYRLSTFIGNVVASSVLTCCFLTPITLFHLLTSCTMMKFSTVSPYLQSEAHSKARRKAFPSCSHRAGQVLGWQKGRLSSHCTPHLARHIHFHKNNSYCSHHWADRLVSDKQRNTIRTVNRAELIAWYIFTLLYLYASDLN